VPLLDPFPSQADLESAPPLPPVTGYLEACAPTRLTDLDGRRRQPWLSGSLP